MDAVLIAAALLAAPASAAPKETRTPAAPAAAVAAAPAALPVLPAVPPPPAVIPPAPVPPPPAAPADERPDGRGIGTRLLHGPAGSRASRGNGISYHGGPLILGTTRVYYIWYGGWAGNTATSILPDLASAVGGSPYFNINTTYFNGSGVPVANAVSYQGGTADPYTEGSALSDALVQTVVSNAIMSGRLPADANGVYFVLTSSDVAETSGFCTQYCGWHTHGSIAGVDVKYAFVGNPERCPSACEAQATGPNGNAGADGMASVIAHELEESVTDPDLNAWYNQRGQENADLCAWNFGSTSTAPNGALYNVTLGTRQYLLQQNWVDASGGYCALKYP